MRNIIFVLVAMVISVSAFAKASVDKSRAGKPAAVSTKAGPKKKLTQEAVFNGAMVNGKYQVAGGAVTAVENEKSLNDIIGGRKDFKDRLKQDLAKAPSKTAAE